MPNQHRKGPTLAARFWAKVNKGGPEHPALGRCWLWTGARSGKLAAGYDRDPATRHVTRQRHVGAARLSWSLHCPALPAGARLRHLCGNPLCVNPGHLAVAGVAAEEAAFLAAICAEPAEVVHRAAYADWLDEHDQPERAALLRP
jgi:uncharacterized protein (TIGR02996 family)